MVVVRLGDVHVHVQCMIHDTKADSETHILFIRVDAFVLAPVFSNITLRFNRVDLN